MLAYFCQRAKDIAGRAKRNSRAYTISKEMIPYILHVTVITTICFLFYKLALQKRPFIG